MVSSGRRVQVGELLQLQRFHNYSVRDIRNVLSLCVHRYTDRLRLDERWGPIREAYILNEAAGG